MVIDRFIENRADMKPRHANANSDVRALVVCDPLPLHNRAAEVVLHKFITVLSDVSSDIRIVSGNLASVMTQSMPSRISVWNCRYNPASKSLIGKGITHAKMQLLMAKEVWRRAKEGANIVFLWHANTQILSLLVDWCI